ncbi:transposase family protein [Gemmata massiliana]|uniref:transposase family protein n=1 Tax=Gemmata massiliana TaxID=1210884 RepID=UPI0013A70B62|nr:transposase family protein [Gemmata massiliana]
MQGPIHPLPAVLGLVTLVVRMGRTSLRGIARFGRQHGHPLARALGFRRGQTPAASTRSRFGPSNSKRPSPGGSVRASPRAPGALDGKCLRGSRGGAGCHRVTAYAPDSAGPGASGRPLVTRFHVRHPQVESVR